MFYRCLSVYRGVPGVWGGMPGPGGYAARGCLVHGGVPGPGGGVPGPWVGGVPDPGREGAWLGGCGAPPLDDYCFGQYASYWNAFLLFSLLIFFAARKRTYNFRFHFGFASHFVINKQSVYCKRKITNMWMAIAILIGAIGLHAASVCSALEHTPGCGESSS